MLFMSMLSCFILFSIQILAENNFAKFNQPAALGAYKDIIDVISQDPIKVLGKTWKKFDYDQPSTAVRGAYKDIIDAVKDPKDVLGEKTFGYGMERYPCRDPFGKQTLCRIMEDEKAN